VQARRKSQYKSLGRGPSTPTTGGRVASGPPKSMSSKAYRSRLFSTGNPTGSNIDSQKAFIRDRFMARCLERATNARERAIKGKRSAMGQAEDAMDLGNDQEENDEFLMQDELFRRILRQTNRSQQHAYQVSYYDEVGSSFDPDLEDIGEWERELSKREFGRLENFDPAVLDDEELQAYAEEYAKLEAIAEFDDIPEEELFDLQWYNESEETPSTQNAGPSTSPEDDDMDLS
ncbi:hypothetical protein BJ165DRAFT_1307875, partial [Panaeolus papilionaceus]